MNIRIRERSSADGSGMSVPEETTTSLNHDDKWNTTIGTFSDFNATTYLLNSTYARIPEFPTYKYVMYIGGGLSIVSCLIALFSYTASKKFRVKRNHMITINLCVSLLIFYVGILIAVSNSSHVLTFDDRYDACVAAAVLFYLGVLLSWTWITAHWTYLTYTVHKAAASHISHFAIKITLPAYGLPSFFTGAIVIANAAAEPGYYISRKTCMFKLKIIPTAVLNFLYLAICFIIIASCLTYCVCRLTCKRDENRVESTRMRIKVNVTRLVVITMGVMIITMLELIRSGVVVNESAGWFEILNGAIFGAAGIAVSVGLTLRSKEFRLYLVKRSQSAAALRRLASTFRRKSRKTKGNPDKNGNRLRTKSSKQPTPVFYDKVRPPKPMPRDDVSRHSRPHMMLAPLVTFLNSNRNSRNSNEAFNMQGTTNDIVSEEPKPVDNSAGPIKRRQRFSSFHRRTSQLRSTKSERTRSAKLPSNLPMLAPQPARRRTRMTPEESEKTSISSLDMCRKSSF